MHGAAYLYVEHSTVTPTVVALSGGVFQNEMLLRDLKSLLAGRHIDVWTNRSAPPNDGGISLGQAALAAFTYLNKPR